MRSVSGMSCRVTRGYGSASVSRLTNTDVVRETNIEVDLYFFACFAVKCIYRKGREDFRKGRKDFLYFRPVLFYLYSLRPPRVLLCVLRGQIEV
jgi:hypothetical protein